MCTSIIEIIRVDGMAKRDDSWFPLTQTVVAYDHARHAPLGDCITLDFVNASLGSTARTGVELALSAAKELRAALERAITAAEAEEAEETKEQHEEDIPLISSTEVSREGPSEHFLQPMLG